VSVQRIVQVASALSSATGTATFTFPNVPQGYVWEGTVSVPGSPTTAIYTVSILGQNIAAFGGSSTWGPITLVSPEALKLTGAGLQPSVNYEAVFVGLLIPSSQTTFRSYPQPLTTPAPSGAQQLFTESGVSLSQGQSKDITVSNVPVGMVALNCVMYLTSGAATQCAARACTGVQSGASYTQTASSVFPGGINTFAINLGLDTSYVIQFQNENDAGTSVFLLSVSGNY
jgi:hypothetical protein